MRRAGVGQALQGAYTFLQKVRVEELSDADCAAILEAVPPVTDMADVRARLAARLLPLLEPDWFASSELSELFCTLNAVHAYDKQLVTGRHLALAAQRLVAAEVRVGGPYAERDGRLSPLAHAHITLCMQWAGALLPQVRDFLVQNLPAGTLNRPEDRLFMLYFQRAQKEDAQIASDQHRLSWRKLLGPQQMDGGWPARRMAGGRPVVTALALRCLADEQPTPTTRPAARWPAQSAAVVAACRRTYDILEEPLRTHSLTALGGIQAADHEYEIALLPAFFAHALRERQLDTRLCRLLGQANVHAWIAYGVYDDFLDDAGDPNRLSPANVALRCSLEAYHQALPDAAFQEMVREAFTAVDAANAWEIAQCRAQIANGQLTVTALPDFGDLDFLAKRTYIHVLGPLGVLHQAGVSASDKRWRAARSGLRHYLIARQLNDDIHDWQQDVAAGHITPVVAALLRRLQVHHGTRDLGQLIHQARQLFWQEITVEIAATAQHHITLARGAFRKSGLLTERNQIMLLLEGIEHTLEDGLARRTRNQEFLQTFEQPSGD